ncbi:MAG TPA: glycosyltransferase [Firmicutes bacterium]|jgi:GT2 family glycosyltransferase/glycosyltransferase involved in cell wall biosynthesis|nr:glycosyltransferase [Bacillota bacterium]
MSEGPNTVQNEPLNILMLVDSLGIGGTETHVLAIAKVLQKKGHNVIIGTGGGPMASRYKDAGLEVFLMPFQSDNPLYTNYTALLDQTRKLVRERQIQLIHAHQIAGLKVAAQIWQELLVPLVFTIHGMFYPRRRLQSLIDSCAHVIAVSPPAAAWAKKQLGLPASQISVIPNGIDISHFKPGTASSFKNELGMDEKQPLITLCSRIAWGKTRVIEDAIYAVEELHQAEGVHLAIVGSGPDSPFVHALANMVNQRQGYDIIHLTGAMLDPVDAYRAADIVIGTARVALEAMSTCTPVIAAGNSGYFGPVTPSNFSRGWEVYFGDHDFLTLPSKSQLQHDITAMLHGRIRAEQDVLRRLVAAHFRIETVAGAVEELYHQVMAGEIRPRVTNVKAVPTLPQATPSPAPSPEAKKEAAPATPPAQIEASSPLVSVVIPTYNRANLLNECLKSVFEQTYRPLEVIVIDDHSTDDTETVVASWAKKAEETDGLTFHYHRLHRNLGFAKAVTMGYLFAQGAFIANHDSDDISHPDRITQQVQFLQLNPDHSLVGTNYEVFSDDVTQRKKAFLVRYDKNIISSYRAGHHCVCFGSLLMRREVIERLGGLTTFLQGAEDYEFVSRAIVQGFNVQNLRTPLYYYREHGTQRSKEFYGVRSALTSQAVEGEGA